MAQLLVTIENNWYQNIASVRNYSEGDFEDKILKYATDIFTSYYVLRCKFLIQNKSSRSERYRPDFVLVSKNFKNWIIVEVELCGKPLKHTFDQLRCFHNPEYEPVELKDYLIRNNPIIKDVEAEVLQVLENKDPKILVIYDDYCTSVFEKIKGEFPDLQICVVETYRTSGHPSESYRISGEYPYEISGISPLKLFDNQHYELLRPELLKDYSDDEQVEINYSMRILKARVFRNKKKVFIKIPENPLPPGTNFQIEIDIADNIIIKRV